MRITDQNTEFTDPSAGAPNAHAISGSWLDATLATVAKIIIAASVLSMPIALWALREGSLLSFVAAIVSLAGASGALSLVHQANRSGATKVIVATILMVGGLFAWSNPVLADLGLAIVLLAPIVAHMLGDGKLQKLAWGVAGGVFVTSLFFGAPLGMFGHELAMWSAAATYAGVAAAVAYAGGKLSKITATVGKAQIDTFQHLVENIHGAVLRLTPRGYSVFASRSAEQTFGCPRYELMGDGILGRVHIQDKPLFLKALSDATNSDNGRLVELRMRRDDPNESGVPTYIWTEIGFSMVQSVGQSSEDAEIVALVRDISVRKAQEAETLEARKVAEEASNTKSRFLATIGHELRTPLNAIVGFSDMLSSGMVGQLDDTQTEYAELIRKSGYHLLDIVNMLLEMSKIEADKFELQLEGVQPAELINPCVQIVEQLAAEKSVRIRTELANTLPTFMGDERAYRQIVINLLSNAIKFSHPDAEIVLKVKRQGADMNISVTDTGIGMARETVERLGEAFYQAEQGMARKYEGTGLGLSIVKGLVELHDGKLHVRSELGKGTTMTILVPLAGPAPRLEPSPVVTNMPAKSDPVSAQTEHLEKKAVAQ